MIDIENAFQSLPNLEGSLERPFESLEPNVDAIGRKDAAPKQDDVESTFKSLKPKITAW